EVVRAAPEQLRGREPERSCHDTEHGGRREHAPRRASRKLGEGAEDHRYTTMPARTTRGQTKTVLGGLAGLTLRAGGRIIAGFSAATVVADSSLRAWGVGSMSGQRVLSVGEATTIHEDGEVEFVTHDDSIQPGRQRFADRGELTAYLGQELGG